jgi:hypothetical protein
MIACATVALLSMTAAWLLAVAAVIVLVVGRR